MRTVRGVTLIEMVVVLVLMGIIGAAFAVFIVPAVRGYFAQGQRAALVDAAENALRRIARDIRIAVPNSLRRTTALAAPATGFALELVPTADGGRYCFSGEANCSSRPPSAAFNNLDVTAADSDFTILGCFQNAAFAAAAAGGTTAYRLVINNRAAADLYGAAGGANEVITPAGTTLSLAINPGTGATPTVCGSASATAGIINAHHLAIGGGGYDFMADSSRRRVYVVESAASAVTYVCDTNAGTLTRYAGYGIQSAQPSDPASAPLSTAPSRALVAQHVTSCSVTDTLSIEGSGLVTLDLGIAAGGETVRLLYQVQIDNSQ